MEDKQQYIDDQPARGWEDKLADRGAIAKLQDLSYLVYIAPRYRGKQRAYTILRHAECYISNRALYLRYPMSTARSAG